MDEQVLMLKIQVYNNEKYFEINFDNNIKIEDIKKMCQKEFKYSNKDINNIYLWYIDDDNDKNLINNDIDLMEYVKEINPSIFLIKLYVDINNKIKEDNINEFNEKEDKDKDKQNNKYYENDIEKKNKEINELEKQNKILNSIINNYKERIKNIISYYEKTIDEIYNKLENEIKNQNIIKDENINKKIEHNINNNNNNNNIQSNLNNNKIKNNGKSFYIKNLEFINNRCKKCNEKSVDSIYKCVLCDNLFLCKKCYKNNKDNTNKVHEHNVFFEIIYPNEIIKQIKDDINENNKYNKIINSFYKLINNIFFENGNISLKPFKDCDTKNLNQICKDMKSINKEPIEYFSEYQKVYIKKELIKLKSEKIILQIAEKEKLFLNRVCEALNN